MGSRSFGTKYTLAKLVQSKALCTECVQVATHYLLPSHPVDFYGSDTHMLARTHVRMSQLLKNYEFNITIIH